MLALRSRVLLRLGCALAASALVACGGADNNAGDLGGFNPPGEAGVTTTDSAVVVGPDAAPTGNDAALPTEASVSGLDSSLPTTDGGGTDGGTRDGGTPDTAMPDTGEPDAGADGGDNPIAKYGLTPLPITGTALPTTPDKTWTWIDFPDTKCRDGSQAGIGIRRNNASKDLMIFLEGGGACFDDVTCLANPGNASTWKNEPKGGILNPADASNPLKDWNLVYIPYCTGDVHAGTRTDVRVSGLFPKEQFVGYLNMEKYLQRVVPTFPDPARVLLTGISAGGFGASSTAILVQRAFPNEKIIMIDDSGPPQNGEVVPPCLQKKMRELWGLDKSVLKDCGAGCPDPDDYQDAMGIYLTKKFNDRPSGLISSIQDGIISGFFGAGNNNCTGIALVDTVPPAVFEKGLLDFRAAVKDSATFSTYYPKSTQHTWLTDLFDVKFNAAEVNGVKLTKWVSDILEGKPPAHVGP
jgi:hypothetical protein